MLNRRNLRIRAMQNLYAYNQSKYADYFLAEGKIKERFSAGWDAKESEIQQFESNKIQALRIFKETYEQESVVLEESVNNEIKEAIQDARDFYRNQLETDLRAIRKNMVTQTERVYDFYLLIILLLIKISDFVKLEWQEREKRHSQLKTSTIRSKTELNLFHNQLIKLLREDDALQESFKGKKAGSYLDKDTLWRWYKEIIKKDEVYQEYLKVSSPKFKDDQSIVAYLVKQVILKNESIQEYFNSIDIYWTEDRKVVKSMVMKTIKSAEDGKNQVDLALISTNWEEDKAYFSNLFERAVSSQRDNEQLLVKKIKNWEIDRIAIIDYILLQLAICEMINFPSIPVKVTINEYIEISKNYSTPKSKQFINGVLDVIANELVNEGVIRKSGRGLIDNK